MSVPLLSVDLSDPSSELGSTISIVLLWHYIMCMPCTLGIQLLMIPFLPMLSVYECQVHNYIRHSKWSANMFVSCDLKDKTCIFFNYSTSQYGVIWRYKHDYDLTQKLYFETHSQFRFFFRHYCVWQRIERWNPVLRGSTRKFPYTGSQK